MNSWAISCNLKYYDVYGAFSKFKALDWKQTSLQVEVNDIVYIYISAPEQEIRYKCRVTKTFLDHIEIDDSEFIKSGESFENYPRHMELELLETYPSGAITKKNLEEHGLKGNIMRPRQLKGNVLSYIESV